MGNDMDDTRDAQLVAGFWQAVAARGWHGLTMQGVSAASGLPLAELRRLAPSPLHLLRLHARVVDRTVLAGTVPSPLGSEPARDRMFDVLMRRIDALQPHRAGILRLAVDARADPLLALALLAALPGSMAWMLEAAAIGTAGLPGLVRAKGLAAIWLYTLRAWTRDGTADLGATMAALDRALDRAEQVARTLRLDPPGPPRDVHGDPAEAA
jgi:ubiquinone biosynthesis protein COQ9